MLTLQRTPALRIAPGTRKTSKPDQEPAAAVPAGRVREMLLEIAFVLHATRVVRMMDEGGVASKKG